MRLTLCAILEYTWLSLVATIIRTPRTVLNFVIRNKACLLFTFSQNLQFREEKKMRKYKYKHVSTYFATWTWYFIVIEISTHVWDAYVHLWELRTLLNSLFVFVCTQMRIFVLFIRYSLNILCLRQSYGMAQFPLVLNLILAITNCIAF